MPTASAEPANSRQSLRTTTASLTAVSTRTP
jgi:hypothetical protein